MPYATQDDLVPQRLTLQQLVQLTTEAGTIVPDANVVNAALVRASAVVDSFCGERYVTPLQNSVMATQLTADLAVYRLYQRRGQVKETSAQAMAYRDAIATLKEIRDGKAMLDIPANTPAQNSSGPVLVTQIPQTFAGVNDEGWL